jgi:hypothetical protein
MTSCLGQKVPQIGDVWAGKVSSDKIYLFPPFGFQNKIVFEVNKKKFTGAVKDGSKEIIFLSTTDPDFVVNKKKYIGLPLSSFSNKNDITIIMGWGGYIKVTRDWYAGFDDRKLSDSSKVRFLFKF